ncbi:3-oxoacyl-[acyl-carrier-protein] synthase-1 [Mesonia hippocampi]|uniref:3-oxoacyl-[acyl-carrier-protein] synthase-1 n=1 Tax=Mesonia hippocampi TaxID=1628250 RepID=A0A840EFJ8_9FLAO|nr:beta-ketoacyl-[acyl-carrier-protein] synthase family protein [Mesonia hippocampi]MBB4117982.1 3-oxoacyl-[acyl-carrier-protein] synthase-1 [Mesonia hippocampi]
MKIAITGMGIISAIGNTVAENFAALKSGKAGISNLENISNSVHKGVLKVGEIKLSDSALAAMLKLPETHNFSRTSLLGAYAAKKAVENANISDINAYATGLVSATSVGGMDKTEQYFYQYFEDPSVRKFITSHDAGDVSHKIADALGLKGMVTTISTACSSAANAIMMGARLIASGQLDRVIVGGTDALSKFTINGFNTLMILSDTYNTPFDENRKGLNLGEAAAYLVLESDKVIKETNKEVLAYLSGYGNANDAYHQTASSANGEGAFLAMKKALQMANISSFTIDYINVHGTATPNNDLSEGHALQRVFGTAVPHFSSTKPYTGHTLAAAAAIEAVYSILALQHNLVFPNLNFKNKMEELYIQPTTVLLEKELNTVLSNSFGFGGNCSALIFSKP